MTLPLSDAPQAVKQRQIFEYHPVIAYRYIPGIKARIPHPEAGGYLIEVNESGFRCKHNFVCKKPAGVRRVLLFGDSFAAGDGVSNSKRFGDLVEQSLPGLEVYNFALPGTGTDQQFLTFQSFAKEIDYDLLVISIFVENIRRVSAHYRFFINENGEKVIFSKPYYELQQGKLVLKNVPVDKAPIQLTDLNKDQAASIDYGLPMKKIVRSLDRVGGMELGTKITHLLDQWGVKNALQKSIHYQPIPEYDRPDQPAWMTMRAILEEWINCQAKPVLLLLLPLPQYVEGIGDPRQYQARFQELAEASGCRVYDALPDLLRLPADVRGKLYYQEGHFNQYGHATIANLLTPVIDQLLAK